jgi:protein tyrosine/serine phosphatase
MGFRKHHLIISFLIFPASLALYLGLLQIDGNFHTVTAGRYYRSAQPTAGDLTAYARAFGIKSVINLRGRHPGERWYEDEMRVSDELGLHHIDLALSARRELSNAQLSELEKALREAPEPILVHCKSGADRTGLAAALYVFEVERLSADTAAAQLSWVYGHWTYFGSRPAAMDRTFDHAVSLHSEDRRAHEPPSNAHGIPDRD